MYCTNCGAKMPDDARFCTECGTPVATGTAEPVSAEAKPKTTVVTEASEGGFTRYETAEVSSPAEAIPAEPVSARVVPAPQPAAQPPQPAQQPTPVQKPVPPAQQKPTVSAEAYAAYLKAAADASKGIKRKHTGPQKPHWAIRLLSALFAILLGVTAIGYGLALGTSAMMNPDAMSEMLLETDFSEITVPGTDQNLTDYLTDTIVGGAGMGSLTRDEARELVKSLSEEADSIFRNTLAPYLNYLTGATDKLPAMNVEAVMATIRQQKDKINEKLHMDISEADLVQVELTLQREVAPEVNQIFTEVMKVANGETIPNASDYAFAKMASEQAKDAFNGRLATRCLIASCVLIGILILLNVTSLCYGFQKIGTTLLSGGITLVCFGFLALIMADKLANQLGFMGNAVRSIAAGTFFRVGGIMAVVGLLAVIACAVVRHYQNKASAEEVARIVADLQA